MWTLALETSGPIASVALAAGHGIAAQDLFESQQTLSVSLLGRVEGVLRGAGVALSELRRIAVGLGPGSFTGLRIGVTTARTLAHALELPIVGCESPVALWRAAAEALHPAPGTVICAAVPSKRDEAYVLARRVGDAAPLGPAAEYQLVPLDLMNQFAEAQGASCVFVGAPAREAFERTAGGAFLAPSNLDYPTAEMIHRTTAGLPEMPLALVRPRYVRSSQAEAALGVGPRPWAPAAEGCNR